MWYVYYVVGSSLLSMSHYLAFVGEAVASVYHYMPYFVYYVTLLRILEVHMLPSVGRLATIFSYHFAASRPAGYLLYIYSFHWCDRLVTFFRLA